MPPPKPISNRADELEIPVWPHAPSGDLPQVITLLVLDEKSQVVDIIWSEAMGFLDTPIPSTRLTSEQLTRLAEWLQNWLKSEPLGFTERGISAVQRMLESINRCNTYRSKEALRKSQWETHEFDHLL